MKRIALLLLLILAVFVVKPTNSTTFTTAYAEASHMIQLLDITQNSTQQNSTQTNSTTLNQTQPLFTNEILIDQIYYVPTTITLNFPSTTATSLSNVTTVSGSGYNYAGDDHSFTFIAKTIDVYSFSFTISYANATLNDILIATWQGNSPMQGETWAAVASTYVVSFRLSMTNEPSYPSASDVASQSLYQFQELFQQLLSQDQATANDASAMSTTAAFVSIISVVASFATMIVAIRFMNRFKTWFEEKGHQETS